MATLSETATASSTRSRSDEARDVELAQHAAAGDAAAGRRQRDRLVQARPAAGHEVEHGRAQGDLTCGPLYPDPRRSQLLNANPRFVAYRHERCPITDEHHFVLLPL